MTLTATSDYYFGLYKELANTILGGKNIIPSGTNPATASGIIAILKSIKATFCAPIKTTLNPIFQNAETSKDFEARLTAKLIQIGKTQELGKHAFKVDKITPAPKAPKGSKVKIIKAKQGDQVKIVIKGKNLDQATNVVQSIVAANKIKKTVSPNKKTLTLEFKVPQKHNPGNYSVTLVNANKVTLACLTLVIEKNKGGGGNGNGRKKKKLTKNQKAFKAIQYIRDVLGLRFTLGAGGTTYPGVEKGLPTSLRPAASILGNPSFSASARMNPLFKPKKAKWLNIKLRNTGIDYQGYYQDGSHLINLGVDSTFRFLPFKTKKEYTQKLALDLDLGLKYRYSNLKNPIQYLFFNGHKLLALAGLGIGSNFGKDSLFIRAYARYLMEHFKDDEHKEFRGESHAVQAGAEGEFSIKPKSIWNARLRANLGFLAGDAKVPGRLLGDRTVTKDSFYGFRGDISVFFPRLKYKWGVGLKVQHHRVWGWRPVTLTELSGRVDLRSGGALKVRGGYYNGGIFDGLTVYNLPGSARNSGYVSIQYALPQLGGQRWLKAFKLEGRADIYGKKSIFSGMLKLDVTEFLYYLLEKYKTK
jgi:hypothetical protein